MLALAAEGAIQQLIAFFVFVAVGHISTCLYE
jgi:hypothetical protein